MHPDEKIDLNGDGKIDSNEYQIYERRAQNRRKIAWISLFAMILTALLLIFCVPESKIEKLGAVLELYWLSLGGIVGAYVGISAWHKKG